MAWAVVGVALNLLPLKHIAVIVMVLYATYYGLVEATHHRGVPPPGSRWQVPQSFVIGISRRRRILVWGCILGPGFATRNPYAGFGLLPLALAAVGNLSDGIVLGGAVGMAHGIARAIALLRDARGINVSEYLQSVLKSMYWRAFDGFSLLVVAGVAATICLQTL